jgi:cyclohexadieny/prephenate dehydrogenase
MSAPLFNKVAIIGIGLIGSSLARGIRREKLAKTIVAGDASAAHCREAKQLKIVDSATTNLKSAVQDADLVILAVPVGACGAVAKTIAPALKAGAILTDVGSVKGAVINAVAPHVPKGVHFIPGHPIAGTEHSGPGAGFAELFHGRWAILTPGKGANKAAVKKLAELWRRCGSKVEIMDVKRHDRVLAITSHLPHLIAYTIVGTAADLETDTKGEVIKYSAGGFRDFTRIAGSDPTMWRDIFINNQEAVLDIAQRLTEDLTALQKAIRRGDGQTLFDLFSRTRSIRKKVIEAKQA